MVRRSGRREKWLGNAIDGRRTSVYEPFSRPVHARDVIPGTRVAAVLAVVLVGPGLASGYDEPVELGRVAATFAGRDVEVRCPSADEWAADPNAAGVWSYAHLRRDFMALSPALCGGALGVGDADIPAWQRAAGVLALVHESYHLRRWRYRRDEARVTCAAIRRFQVAVLLLGGSDAVANDLLPFALALHLRTVQVFPLYRSATCRLPVWRPPGEADA